MLNALVPLVSVLNLAAPPETEVAVRAAVVSILPQGRSTVVIFNRGANAGVELGDRVEHPAGRCRLLEVYQLRSKCIMEVDIGVVASQREVVVHVRRPASPPPAREARVLSQAPDEDGTSLELDLGYVHGVRLDDEGVVQGRPCRVWQVDAATSWCATELRPVSAQTVSLSPSALPGRATTAGMMTWGNRPYDARVPEPGVTSPALPVVVARLRREGLRASRSCVGVTPDGARSYWLVADPTPAVQPLPKETGLALEELEHGAALSRGVARFGPLEVKRALGHLATLIADQRLEACHLGGTRMIDPDGTGPLGVVQVWLADHGGGRATYLYQREHSPDILVGRPGEPPAPKPFITLAPLPPGPDADPAARPRYPWISQVLFRPGEPRHLVRIDGRWHPLELAP